MSRDRLAIEAINALAAVDHLCEVFEHAPHYLVGKVERHGCVLSFEDEPGGKVYRYLATIVQRGTQQVVDADVGLLALARVAVEAEPLLQVGGFTDITPLRATVAQMEPIESRCRGDVRQEQAFSRIDDRAADGPPRDEEMSGPRFRFRRPVVRKRRIGNWRGR